MTGFKPGGLYVALALGGLACAGGVARAQDAGTSQVTITIPAQAGQVSTSGVGRLQDVSMSAPVTYGDLDLSTRQGAEALHGRIADAARGLCVRLDIFHPIGNPDADTCTRMATQAALDEVLGPDRRVG